MSAAPSRPVAAVQVALLGLGMWPHADGHGRTFHDAAKKKKKKKKKLFFSASAINNTLPAFWIAATNIPPPVPSASLAFSAFLRALGAHSLPAARQPQAKAWAGCVTTWRGWSR